MSTDKARITLFSDLTIQLPDSADQTPVASKKVSHLIGLLAINVGNSLSREFLIDALYPDDEIQDSAPRFRWVLSELRRALEPEKEMRGRRLLSPNSTLQLDPATVTTDASKMESLIKKSRDLADPNEQLKLLSDAVALYRGRLLPNLYDDSILAAGNFYEQLFEQAMHQLVQLALRTGDIRTATDASKRFLMHSPQSETAHRDRFLTLLAEGDRGGARKQLKEFEEALARDNATLSKATRDWFHQQLDAAEPEPAPPPVQRPNLVGSVAEELPSTLAPMEHPFEEAKDPPQTPQRIRRKRKAPSVALGIAALLLIGFGVAQVKKRPVTAPASASKASSLSPITAYRYKPEGTERDSHPTAIAHDQDGNIFVGGFVDNDQSNVDFVILKLDHNLKPIWKRKFNGKGNDLDRLVSLATDQFGNVIVTGESDNGKGNGQTKLSGLDMVTRKYDRDGNVQWTRVYNGKVDGEDRPTKLLVGGDMSVLVVGTTFVKLAANKEPIRAIVAIRYDKWGKEFWRTVIQPDPARDYQVEDVITADSGGNVIAGTSRIQVDPRSTREIVTLEITEKGDVRWQRSYPGPLGAQEPNREAQVESATLVRQMNSTGEFWVFSSARTVGADGKKRDLVALNYDIDGKLSWSRPFAVSANYSAKVVGLFVPDYGTQNVKVLVATPMGEVCSLNSFVVDIGRDGSIKNLVTFPNFLLLRDFERGLYQKRGSWEVTVLHHHSLMASTKFGKTQHSFMATKYGADDHVIWRKSYPMKWDLGGNATPWLSDRDSTIYAAVREHTGNTNDITVLRIPAD